MVVRKADMWTTTRDTAYAVIGLSGYAKQTGELLNPSSASVYVDGKLIRVVSLDPKKSHDPSWVVTVPRDQLRVPSAHVEIKPSGTGTTYYSMQLKTLDTTPMLRSESTDRGLQIERSYYRLEPQKMENGIMKLLPTKKPVTQFSPGDFVRVEITVRSATPRQFVMIEEPIPSNCRITERDELQEGESWNFWWSRTVIRDDRMAFFATSFPKGVSKITYNMRAEQPGKVRALPTAIANMYDPDRNASTGEATLEVTP
jgi:uncharacterized protein YfaS (alpha-2-macroglobulin family)